MGLSMNMVGISLSFAWETALCSSWGFFIIYFSFSPIILQLGAAAVNLVAGEKPADVYSGIAAR